MWKNQKVQLHFLIVMWMDKESQSQVHSRNVAESEIAILQCGRIRNCNITMWQNQKVMFSVLDPRFCFLNTGGGEIADVQFTEVVGCSPCLGFCVNE